MELTPEQEFFATELKFDDIENIKKVFQPGFLSLPYFFEPTALNQAIHHICGYSSRQIHVHFNAIEDINVVSSGVDSEEKWWNTFQSFTSKVSRHFPAGCKLEYWYGPDGKPTSSEKFNEKDPPYQAFVRLFDDSVQGFSCFVNQSPNNLEFSSRQTAGNLTHGKRTSWVGDSEKFLESAQILHDALYEMGRPISGYRVGVEQMAGTRRREVRIINPEYGAIVGSLYGNDSIALLMPNSSITKVVEPHMRAREKLKSRWLEGKLV